MNIKFIKKTLEKNNFFFNGRYNFFQFFLIIVGIYFFFSFYNYLSLKIFSHSGDTSLFIDIIDKLSKFNDYDASTVHSTFFHFFDGQYLGSNPEIYCDLEKVVRKENYNMYEKSHLYFFAWFLSLFGKIGISASLISVFIISLFYALVICLLGFFLYNQKVNLINTIFFLIIIISWKPFALTIMGQIYFDRFFIIFMTVFILLYYDYFKKKLHKKKLILYFLSILICSIHERAALMLSVFLLSEIFLYHFFSKEKNIIKNLDFLIIGILSFLYFITYIKLFQNTPLGSHLSFSQIVLEINKLFSGGSLISDLGIKLLIVLFPLIFFSFFDLKFLVISLLAILPNYLVSIGGAEKIGFLSHYHSYYIPFLICSALFGFVKFQNYLKKKNILFLFIIFLIIFHNIFFDYSNTKKIITFKNTLNEYDIFDALIFNKSKITELKNEKNFKIQIKEDIKKDNSNQKLVLSLNENFMTAFFETNYLINVFPMEIPKSDYLITSIDNNEKIYVPYFVSDRKKYNMVQNCVQNFIDKRFIRFKEYYNNYQKIIIFKKNESSNISGWFWYKINGIYK